MRRIRRGSNGLGISEPGPKPWVSPPSKPRRDHVRRRIARQLRDGLDRRELHLLVDRGGADIERAAEDEGKAQDVVDLVGEVRAAGADHRVGPRLARLSGMISGVGLASAMISGLSAICLTISGFSTLGRRQAEEDVGAADHLGQRALVGLLRIDRLPAVHQRVAAFVDHAVDVGDPDVLALRAQRHQQVEAGDRRRARAGGDDLDVGELLAVQQQRVADGGGDDDRGAMLVVMEDRDLHARLELLLDLEAFRRLDVFEIDAAEGRLQRRHGLDHAVDGVGARSRCRRRRCRRIS